MIATIMNVAIGLAAPARCPAKEVGAGRVDPAQPVQVDDDIARLAVLLDGAAAAQQQNGSA